MRRHVGRALIGTHWCWGCDGDTCVNSLMGTDMWGALMGNTRGDALINKNMS